MKARKTRLQELILYTSLLFFLLNIIFQPASAYSVVEVNPVNTPHGAVILIVDGLGSPYIYPEFTPYALDGNVIDKARAPNMSYIFDNSCRVLDVRAPQTYTEAGHSVLVTGYSKALSDSVRGSATTIYDVAHDYDYFTFGIMEKGDSSAICSKQDVIIHDTANSINKPQMVIDTNVRTASDKQISMDVAALMQDGTSKLQIRLDEFDEGSQERYDACNVWAIETGIEVVDLMQAKYPGQPYILTINVGAVDSAGHYKKDSGYLSTIEGLDAASMELYRKCTENDLAFIFTADHGMAFASTDVRGGHQSDRYSGTDEAQRVPFVIAADDIENTLIRGEFGQEDIAPTILEILDLPAELRLSDGEAMGIKDQASLLVTAPDEGTIKIERDGAVISEISVSDECLFRGLESGYDYTINFVPADAAGQAIEKEIFLLKSETIDLRPVTNAPENDISLGGTRYLTGGILILIVNITGFALIRRILKE